MKQNALNKNFYLCKRERLSNYDELIDRMESGGEKQVEIWEARNRNRDYHVIIIHGNSLPENFCFHKKIWKMNEKIFMDYYGKKIEEYKIHYFKN